MSSLQRQIMLDSPVGYWPLDESPVFSDSFTRPDNASVLGLSWAARAGVWGIVSNQAYVPAGSGFAVATVSSPLADAIVSTKLAAAGGAGQGNGGVVFRYTDANNHWHLIADGSTGQLYLQKVSGGTTTSLWNGSSFAAGDVISAQFVGSSITVKKNGTALTTVSDAFNSAATEHGLWSNSSSVWKLDDFSITPATAKDRSGNGRDGTYTGSVTPAARTLLGRAAPDFTGGYVTIPDNAAFSPEAGASGLLTLEAWVIADTTNGTNRMWIFTKGVGSAQYEWAIFQATSGAIAHDVWQLSGTAVVDYSSPAAIALGVPLHVVATFDRAAPLAILYLNGVEVARTTTFSSTASDGTSSIDIGRRADNAAVTWDGAIRDVAIYNTALTAARVKAHYEAGVRSGTVFG